MRSLLSLLTPLVLVGCAPALRVTRVEPAPIDLGPTRTLALTVDSPPSGNVLLDIATAFLGGVQSSDPSLPVDDLNASLRNRLIYAAYALGPAETTQMQVHVTVVDYARDLDDAGTLTMSATVHLRISDASGQWLIERDYQPSSSGTVQKGEEPSAHYEELMTALTDQAAASIVDDLSPRTYGERITLDDDDERVKHAVELIAHGQLVAARAELGALLQATPTLAPAVYDLGVADEGMNDLRAAGAHYRQAQKLAPSKALYDEAAKRVVTLQQKRVVTQAQ